MIWFRKGLVLLLSGLLLVSLVGGVAALDVNRDLANPKNLEGWLAKSGIYDRMLASTISQVQKSDSNNDGSGSISLSDPVVQQSAAKVFTPDLIQQTVNAYLEGNYAWLTGKKAAPDYHIDLTSAKQTFAQQIGQATQAHLSGLPVCNPAQLAQLPIPVDPLTINCRPGTLDPKAEGDRVAQEVNDSNVIIGNPVITPNSVNQDRSAQGGSSPGQPYYQRLSWLPRAYQIGLKLPWMLGGLALISALGIIFIAVTRRRGVRRIGWVLLVAGLALVALKLMADKLVAGFDKLSISNAIGSQFKQSLSDFMHQYEPHVVRHYLLFGGVFVVTAIVIFVVLIATRQKSAKPAAAPVRTPAANTPAPDLDEPGKITDPSDIELAPRRTAPPAIGAGTPAGSDSRQLKPLGKNPPRRKPPKLIQ